MTKLLKSNWAAILLGAGLYLGVTGYLLAAANVLAGLPRPQAGETSNTTGPSWEFFNPEVDRLLADLAKEKKAVAAREEQLNELATRLEAERAELNIVLASVQRTQKEFDRNVLRVREEESANLKKLAKVYGSMSPEGAAKIIKQMDDDQVSKFLVFMKEDEAAPILESLAKLGEADAKRAAALSDRIRTAIFRHQAPKP